ncbi:15363_t:CDS:2, partial [Dentiscutata heterogama]
QIMQRKGGKPPHSLTKYFYIIPNEWANKSNQKCICRACMDAVGRDFALQDDSMKITNTKRYCANHLRDCSYFATKYSPEQIQLILGSVTPSTPNKRQSTLSQYIGHPLHAFKIPKFERLILRATVSVRVAFRWIENPEVRELFHFISLHLKLPDQKSLSNRILTSATNEVQTTIKELAYDTASDNDLKLPADIKVTINRDSFWDSLTTLHKILHPFCGALDLMQRNKAHLHNEELLIDKEFEEDPDDLDNADMDFLDLEIYPAENQAAKWKLHDLFLSDLPFPFE